MSDTPDSCTWTLVEFDETFQSDCGHVYEFLDGNVDDNGFKFCPFCGKGIIAVEWEDEDTEEE